MTAPGRILAALLGCSLAACATSGRPIDPSKVATFQRGRTTVAEVQAALGPPNAVSILPDGSSVVTYAYTSIRTRPETFIPYVGLFVGGADSESQAASFMFGPDGILRSESGYGGRTSSSLGGATITGAP